jgi:hypothetical protein
MFLITQAASWYASMEAFHGPVSRVAVSPGFQISGFRCLRLVALKKHHRSKERAVSPPGRNPLAKKR